MSTDTAIQPNPPPAADPFALGWRYIKRERPDGTIFHEQIPLSERDLLYPEEDDFVVTNENHVRNCLYLRNALTVALADRPHVKVFFDHRIDFQVPGLQALGPDLAVIDGLTREWNPTRGTFPVKDFNAVPLMVVEVTSPGTRNGDLDHKVGFYQRAQVPVYVLADLRTREDTSFMAVMGYRLDHGHYVRVEPDADGILWVHELGVGFKPVGLRVFLLDRNGNRLPEHEELDQQVRELTSLVTEAEQRVERESERADKEKYRADLEEVRKMTALLRAEQEQQRAEQEKQRADAEALQKVKEHQRAEQEKQRADQLTETVARMEAELRRLRGETP